MTVDVVRPVRPAQVTVAFWLLLSAAVLLLGVVGVAVAHAFYYDDLISQAVAQVPTADPDEVDSERVGNLVGTLVVGVPPLLLAIWLALTARPVLRGSNIARIMVFVAAGGQVLLGMLQFCGGFVLASVLSSAFEDDGGLDDGALDDGSWENSDFYDTLYNSDEWFSDIFLFLVVAVALIVVLLTLTSVLLLAIPPAHRYFVPKAETSPAWRHTPAGWQMRPADAPMAYFICPDPSAHYLPFTPPAEAVAVVVPETPAPTEPSSTEPSVAEPPAAKPDTPEQPPA